MARGYKVIAAGRFQDKPSQPREGNQVISENVRQQPSRSVQLRLEYAFSVKRRCDKAISRQNGLVTEPEISYTEKNQV